MSMSGVSGHLNGKISVTSCMLLFFPCRLWKEDITENKRSMAKLRAGAETCKHVLTSHGTATCSVESLHDGIDFQCNVSR